MLCCDITTATTADSLLSWKRNVLDRLGGHIENSKPNTSHSIDKEAGKKLSDRERASAHFVAHFVAEE